MVAIPSLPGPRVAEIIETARACGLHVRFLPSFLAAVERDARLSDLRQIRVGDLLGRRELHVVSEKAAALISGQAGTGHRGGRIDRQRAVPPDPAVSGPRRLPAGP